jgi:chromosome segregation ATPase
MSSSDHPVHGAVYNLDVHIGDMLTEIESLKEDNQKLFLSKYNIEQELKVTQTAWGLINEKNESLHEQVVKLENENKLFHEQVVKLQNQKELCEAELEVTKKAFWLIDAKNVTLETENTRLQSEILKLRAQLAEQAAKQLRPE